MRYDFGDFAGSNAVIKRQAKTVRHLNRLIAADQGGDDHDAAVAWI
jgi:hypothetical protein